LISPFYLLPLPELKIGVYGFGFDVIIKHAARSYTRSASVLVPKFDEGQRPIFGLHSRRRTAPAMPHEVRMRPSA
jgi:hypothetical protein